MLLPYPQPGSKWQMAVAFCYLATMNFEPCHYDLAMFKSTVNVKYILVRGSAIDIFKHLSGFSSVGYNIMVI